MEKTVIQHGTPERSVITTCAYCGVGCTFEAELQGDRVVRMTPYKDGKANHGHSCVKGRFAWGYATHKERITKPMIRASIKDPWREVTWDEAIKHTASEFKRIQAKYGKGSIGGITSSRCTNEETFVMQKMIRAAFGNNNVDTCARVCHSPTGYGLKTAFGTSAGTQDFDSVMEADVILIIGANPTDAHPVFASRMKRRIREGGAKVIVIDPRKIDMVRMPHVEASYHLPLKPGTNVAIVNAIAHVIVTEGLTNEKFIAERCDPTDFKAWADFIRGRRIRPKPWQKITGVPAKDIRGAARLYATGGNGAIYYGLGVTEHSQGSTMVMGMANLAMVTGNLGRNGVGVNPVARPEQRAGRVRHGFVPARIFRLPPRVGQTRRGSCSKAPGACTLDPEPGLRIPNMFDAAHRPHLHGPVRAGRRHRAIRSQHASRDGRARSDGMRGGARPVPERDRGLRACVPAGRVVPGEGRHVHQCGTPHRPRAQGDPADGASTPSGK